MLFTFSFWFHHPLKTDKTTKYYSNGCQNMYSMRVLAEIIHDQKTWKKKINCMNDENSKGKVQNSLLAQWTRQWKLNSSSCLLQQIYRQCDEQNWDKPNGIECVIFSKLIAHLVICRLEKIISFRSLHLFCLEMTCLSATNNFLVAFPILITKKSLECKCKRKRSQFNAQ